MELLDSFHILVKRDSIRRTVDKKLIDICSEFSSFVDDIKHHFEHMKSAPNIGKGEPNFGGAARWAYGLSMEVRREWNSFNNAKNVWADNVELKNEVDNTFGKLINVFQEFISGQYTKWLVSLQGLDQADMQRDQADLQLRNKQIDQSGAISRERIQSQEKMTDDRIDAAREREILKQQAQQRSRQ